MISMSKEKLSTLTALTLFSSLPNAEALTSENYRQPYRDASGRIVVRDRQRSAIDAHIKFIGTLGGIGLAALIFCAANRPEND